jgi:hypothetical protein
MRYNNSATCNIGQCKNLVYLLFGTDGEFVAFAQMIFNTIITAQYHTGYQPRHFLGFGIQVPEAFDEILITKNNKGLVVFQFEIIVSHRAHGVHQEFVCIQAPYALCDIFQTAILTSPACHHLLIHETISIRTFRHPKQF